MNMTEKNRLDYAVKTIWNYTQNLEKEYSVKLHDVPIWLGVIESQLSILISWDISIDDYINELFKLIDKYAGGKSKEFMLESEDDLLNLANKILNEQEEVINTYIEKSIKEREIYASDLISLEKDVKDNKNELKNTKSNFVKKIAPGIAGISLATMIVVGGMRTTKKIAYNQSTNTYAIENAYETGAKIEYKHDKPYDVWKYRRILFLGTLLTSIAATSTVFLTLPEIGTIDNFKEDYKDRIEVIKELEVAYKKETEICKLLEKEINDTNVNKTLLMK